MEDKNKISNIDKYYNYKDLMRMLKNAKEVQANLECILIEYAIIEDRTLSICSYLNIKLGSSFEERKLSVKLKQIKKHFKNNQILKTKFDFKIFNDICEWARERNIIVHSLTSQILDFDKYAKVADKGYELVKELNKGCTFYKMKAKLSRESVEYSNREDYNESIKI